jgi:hypothetical protein
MKESVPGFLSIYPYSMGKILTRPGEYKGNVEKFCERRARKGGAGSIEESSRLNALMFTSCRSSGLAIKVR